MKKVYSKVKEGGKPRLLAKIHGDNVVEIKRKGVTYKMVIKDADVIAQHEDDPELVTSFSIENGKFVEGECKVEEVEEKKEDKQD